MKISTQAASAGLSHNKPTRSGHRLSLSVWIYLLHTLAVISFVSNGESWFAVLALCFACQATLRPSQSADVAVKDCAFSFSHLHPLCKLHKLASRWYTGTTSSYDVTFAWLATTATTNKHYCIIAPCFCLVWSDHVLRISSWTPLISEKIQQNKDDLITSSKTRAGTTHWCNHLLKYVDFKKTCVEVSNATYNKVKIAALSPENQLRRNLIHDHAKCKCGKTLGRDLKAWSSVSCAVWKWVMTAAQPSRTSTWSWSNPGRFVKTTTRARCTAMFTLTGIINTCATCFCNNWFSNVKCFVFSSMLKTIYAPLLLFTLRYTTGHLTF